MTMTKSSNCIDNKTCNKICLTYKVKKNSKNQSFYEIEGARYCQHCTIFIKWESSHCPCCGYRLRSRPRSNGGIDKYRKTRRFVYQ